MWLVDALVKIYYLLLNYQGLKLLIDFEKAFDTLEKKILHQALFKFWQQGSEMRLYLIIKYI